MAARPRVEGACLVDDPPADREAGHAVRREFARHLDIASASLNESRDLLDEAAEDGVITRAEYVELDTLGKRIAIATARLASSIRRFPDFQRPHRP